MDEACAEACDEACAEACAEACGLKSANALQAHDPTCLSGNGIVESGETTQPENDPCTASDTGSDDGDDDDRIVWITPYGYLSSDVSRFLTSIGRGVDVEESLARLTAVIDSVTNANSSDLPDIVRFVAPFLSSPAQRRIDLALDCLERISRNSSRALHKEFVDAGAVSRLVKLLKDDDGVIVEKAAGILRNLTHGDPWVARVIAKKGAVSQLVALLWATDLGVAKEAVGALRNMAAEDALAIKDFPTRERFVGGMLRWLVIDTSSKTTLQAVKTLECLISSDTELAKIVCSRGAVELILEALKDSLPIKMADCLLAILRFVVERVPDSHSHIRAPDVTATLATLRARFAQQKARDPVSSIQSSLERIRARVNKPPKANASEPSTTRAPCPCPTSCVVS